MTINRRTRASARIADINAFETKTEEFQDVAMQCATGVAPKQACFADHERTLI
jgi:hypothetical protein